MYSQWSEEILAENDDIIYEQPLIGKRDGNFGKFRFHFFCVATFKHL